MKARIGITVTRSLHQDRLLETINRAYVSAVRRADGTPFVLPVLDPADASAVVSSLDGLLLSGGGDVDPSRYGARAAVEVDGVDVERDNYELALLETALELNLPVLGICRGSQLINVACGGTLVQHLPAVTELSHREEKRFAEPVHSVRIAGDSRLAEVLGCELVGVNTLHHQAVSQVGQGLRVAGWAPDGVIEAIEGVGRERVLGVQWHPELLTDHIPHAALFNWLVHEAVRPYAVTALTATTENQSPAASATAGEQAPAAAVA